MVFELIIPVAAGGFGPVGLIGDVGATGLLEECLEGVGELVSGFVVVGSGYEGGAGGEALDSALQEIGLLGVHASADTGVAGGGVGKENGMTDGVDGAFGKDEVGIVLAHAGEPEALCSALGKAGEMVVLEFVATQALAVVMGKSGVTTVVLAELAEKAGSVENAGR